MALTEFSALTVIKSAEVNANFDLCLLNENLSTSGGIVFYNGTQNAANDASNLFWDNSSKIFLLGVASARSNLLNGTFSARQQTEGTTDNNSGTAIIRNSANTSSPILHFAKSRGAATGSNTVVQSGDGLGRISFQGSDGTNFLEGAVISAASDGTPGSNDMPGRLIFSTTADGASGVTERMRIDSGGRVGIGGTPDSSLDSKLYIKGTFGAGTATSAYGGLYIVSSDSVAANKGGVVSFGGVYTSTTDTRWAAIAGLKENATDGQYGGYLAFYTRSNGVAPAERARIFTGGCFNVGSSTAGLGGGLGETQYGVGAYGTSVGLISKSDGSATTESIVCWNTGTAGDTIFTRFYTEGGTGTVRGGIDYNRAGGLVRYNTTSDKRIKKNIEDSDSAFTLIDKIKVRSYRLKETDYYISHGFIAQEVHSVIPDAVSVGDDGDTVEKVWSMDYSKIVPYLTKAIQELRSEIINLKSERTA